MALNNRLFSLLAQHSEWRTKTCINLIPSENFTSPAVREFLASDLGHRYTLMVNDKIHGVHIKNAYGGTKYTDLIETEAEDIAKRVFGVEFCTLKPLSGHIAGMIMVFALCERNDKIMVIHEKHGGYDGYMPNYIPNIAGLKVDYLPFNELDWNIDSEMAAGAILENKPRLVILGSSFILFPYHIKPIKEACDDVGSLLGYDASHVLGLIGGGEFQQPFNDGVDIVTGSTHKTLFGPQGGLILSNQKDVFDKISNKLTWHTIDNAHQNRIGALGQALLETEEFGAEYAKQVIRNSKRFANNLNNSQIPVKFSHNNYTESHQVLLDIEKIKTSYGLNSMKLSELLESENIIIDAVGRLGTSEMTRRGCMEEDMDTIAEFMRRIIIKREVMVKNEIIDFLKNKKLAYCF